MGQCKKICVSSQNNDPDAYLEEASQIYSTILHKYNSKVRPPEKWPNQVSVTLTGTLWHIRDIDLMKQEMESLIDLKITWTDKRLAWYPNNVRQISTNVSTVWSPELIYSNAVLPPKAMFPATVTIRSEGYILWHRREIITTLCPTDPYSRTQTCTITLQLVSPGSQEYFRNNTKFTMADTFSNHMWNVDDAELNFSDENQTEVNFSLNMKQKAKICQDVLEHENNCSLPFRCTNGVSKGGYSGSTLTLVSVFMFILFCFRE
ncbi:hypothetical protein SNE40_006295 [Patella caerulea]|uniref:Neurotransmitter-gated ion-channel ligand-binding domain-containing protein n=1 Tax=Patella caerulea TaxID=87958 RepID=A0AAN8Q4A9_PATCE